MTKISDEQNSGLVELLKVVEILFLDTREGGNKQGELIGGIAAVRYWLARVTHPPPPRRWADRRWRARVAAPALPHRDRCAPPCGLTSVRRKRLTGH